jgi:hypothetical protein
LARATSRPTSAALALALLLAGCDGGSSGPAAADPAGQARAAVQRYIDAVQANDARAACAAMSVQSQQATGGTGKICETNIAEAIAITETSYKGAKAAGAKVTGDHAVVTVRLADGKVTHLAAVREHGAWKYEAQAA